MSKPLNVVFLRNSFHALRLLMCLNLIPLPARLSQCQKSIEPCLMFLPNRMNVGLEWMMRSLAVFPLHKIPCQMAIIVMSRYLQNSLLPMTVYFQTNFAPIWLFLFVHCHAMLQYSRNFFPPFLQEAIILRFFSCVSLDLQNRMAASMPSPHFSPMKTIVFRISLNRCFSTTTRNLPVNFTIVNSNSLMGVSLYVSFLKSFCSSVIKNS